MNTLCCNTNNRKLEYAIKLQCKLKCSLIRIKDRDMYSVFYDK